MNVREALEKAHKTYPLHNYTYDGKTLDILAPKIEAGLRAAYREAWQSGHPTRYPTRKDYERGVTAGIEAMQ